jgi:rRNA maturation endonuclease Nob1
LSVTDFDNIGLFFDYYNKIKRVIKCENCFRIIKQSNNKTKYCKDCAIEINREKTKERMRSIRMFEIENPENVLKQYVLTKN